MLYPVCGKGPDECRVVSRARQAQGRSQGRPIRAATSLSRLCLAAIVAGRLGSCPAFLRHRACLGWRVVLFVADAVCVQGGGLGVVDVEL